MCNTQPCKQPFAPTAHKPPCTRMLRVTQKQKHRHSVSMPNTCTSQRSARYAELNAALSRRGRESEDKAGATSALSQPITLKRKEASQTTSRQSYEAEQSFGRRNSKRRAFVSTNQQGYYPRGRQPREASGQIIEPAHQARQS